MWKLTRCKSIKTVQGWVRRLSVVYNVSFISVTDTINCWWNRSSRPVRVTSIRLRPILTNLCSKKVNMEMFLLSSVRADGFFVVKTAVNCPFVNASIQHNTGGMLQNRLKTKALILAFWIIALNAFYDNQIIIPCMDAAILAVYVCRKNMNIYLFCYSCFLTTKM